MQKGMGYRKTLKTNVSSNLSSFFLSKCPKIRNQYNQVPHLTHICTSSCLSTLDRICKRNADWFSNNRQPINIDFNRSVVDCGPRLVISC